MATNDKNQKLSKPTSVIVQLTEWFAALAMINLLWILFSIPLVTILPATETLFFMVNRVYYKKEKVSVRLFISYFKSNFRNSYKKNWPILLMSILFGLDYFVINSQSGLPYWVNVISVAISILFFLMSIITLYYFPITFRTDESTKNQWLLSFYLTFKFSYYSLLTVVLIVGLLVVFLFFPAFILFFAASLPALISIVIVDKGLEKLNQ